MPLGQNVYLPWRPPGALITDFDIPLLTYIPLPQSYSPTPSLTMPASNYYDGPKLHDRFFDEKTIPLEILDAERLKFAEEIRECLNSSPYHARQHGSDCICLKVTVMFEGVKKWVCPTCKAMVGPWPENKERHHRIHTPLDNLPCTVEGCGYRTPQKRALQDHVCSQHGVGEGPVCGALFINANTGAWVACSTRRSAGWNISQHRVREHGAAARQALHARYGPGRVVETLTKVKWVSCDSIQKDRNLVKPTEADLVNLRSLEMVARKQTKLPGQMKFRIHQAPRAGPSTRSAAPTPSLSPSTSSRSLASSSSSPAPPTPSTSYASITPWPIYLSTPSGSSIAVRSSRSRSSRRTSPYPFSAYVCTSPLPYLLPAPVPTSPTCKRCAQPINSYLPSLFDGSKIPPVDGGVLCEGCQYVANQQRLVDRRLAVSCLCD